jgi:tryptophanyl-tRNA synthetase
MAADKSKQVMFSGIQPSGIFTLGNYLGAVRNWSVMQSDFDSLFCLVDLHAITVRQDPATLRENIMRGVAVLMACGLDPERCTLFVQSHVPAHSQLSWLLGAYAQFGELSRMTQFKDKSQRYADNINAALFTYPVLMAADILLYQAELVPVGIDQKQHVELTRDIATRFNGIYGDTFTLPDVYFPKVGAKIMSLLDPTKKMSKSDDNPGSYVAVLDEPDVIIKKFRRAVTDSEARVRFSPDKPGVSNLMTIYAALTERDMAAIEAEFEGKGYGDFKQAVAEAVVETLRPVRRRFLDLMENPDYLLECCHKGAEKAAKKAEPTLKLVTERIGLIG